MTAENRIMIHKRFCGPPDSGNGGYVCGLVAQHLKGTAEVRLFKPPPLEKILDIKFQDSNSVLLKDGEAIIASGRHADLSIEIPVPPTFDQAMQASKRYVSAEEHFFPTCFVCGPARKKKDGLCIFPGLIPERDLVASTWIPDETLLDESGQVRREFIWASLDCPGAFAVLGTSIRPVVLGSLTAEIIRMPVKEQPCIAIGWHIESQGRKKIAGTALFSKTGEILAKARAVWIEIPGV